MEKIYDKNGNEYQVGDEVLLTMGEIRSISSIDGPRAWFTNGRWAKRYLPLYEIIRRADGSDPRNSGKIKNIQNADPGNNVPFFGVVKCEDVAPGKKPPKYVLSKTALDDIIADHISVLQQCLSRLCHRDPTPAELYAEFQDCAEISFHGFPQITVTTDFNATNVFIWLKHGSLEFSDKMSITAETQAWRSRLETILGDFRFRIGSAKASGRL